MDRETTAIQARIKKAKTPGDKIRAAAQARKRAPKLASFIEDIFEEFGGTREFARRVRMEFEAAKGYGRTKLIDGLIKLIHVYHDKFGPAGGDLGELDDRELEQIAAGILHVLDAKGQKVEPIELETQEDKA